MAVAVAVGAAPEGDGHDVPRDLRRASGHEAGGGAMVASMQSPPWARQGRRARVRVPLLVLVPMPMQTGVWIGRDDRRSRRHGCP